MRTLFIILMALVFLAACAGSPPDKSDVHATVNKDDLLILDRAAQLLSAPDRWNRNDTRECPPEAKKLSLFCALRAASIEVLGKYDHRRAALQEVRKTINETNVGRKFDHPLMRFNNLPNMTIERVRQNGLRLLKIE